MEYYGPSLTSLTQYRNQENSRSIMSDLNRTPLQLATSSPQRSIKALVVNSSPFRPTSIPSSPMTSLTAEHFQNSSTTQQQHYYSTPQPGSPQPYSPLPPSPRPPFMEPTPTSRSRHSSRPVTPPQGVPASSGMNLFDSDKAGDASLIPFAPSIIEMPGESDSIRASMVRLNTESENVTTMIGFEVGGLEDGQGYDDEYDDGYEDEEVEDVMNARAVPIRPTEMRVGSLPNHEHEHPSTSQQRQSVASDEMASPEFGAYRLGSSFSFQEPLPSAHLIALPSPKVSPKGNF